MYDKEVVLQRMRARRKAREPHEFEFILTSPWFTINLVAIWAMLIVIRLFFVLMPWT